MSTVSTRKVITIRHEYLVPMPANWAEIGKAQSMAKRDLEAAGKQATSDDAVWFDSDDERIIIYWEEKQ